MPPSSFPRAGGGAPPPCGATQHGQAAGGGLPQAVLARLADAPKAVLMLDYDGTLAPFHTDPTQALPYPGVREVLHLLMARTDTRVVIVSGRWLRTLTPLLALSPCPELWGCHGRERLLPGGIPTLREVSEPALSALVQADAWAAELLPLGARIERKPASIAFHWRGCAPPQVRAIRTALALRVHAQPNPTVLGWLPFEGGIELCAPGCTKATAVTTLLREVGPEAFLAYLGDDQTDEEAFAALGRHGLSVLVRVQPRPTHAALRLSPPGELLSFLHGFARARGAPA